MYNMVSLTLLYILYVKRVKPMSSHQMKKKKDHFDCLVKNRLWGGGLEAERSLRHYCGNAVVFQTSMGTVMC